MRSGNISDWCNGVRLKDAQAYPTTLGDVFEDLVSLFIPLRSLTKSIFSRHQATIATSLASKKYRFHLMLVQYCEACQSA